MKSGNIKQIENIRKQIENLVFPKENNKKNKKVIKEINIFNEEKKDTTDDINKKFDEIYDLFNNDKEYKKKIKEEERLKKIKISNIDSFYLKGKFNKEKIVNSKKFEFYDCINVLEKNNHQGRNETNYEEDFSSSDSYDSDLYTLKNRAPKNFKFKTKDDIKNNEGNLLEIIRVLKAFQQ